MYSENLSDGDGSINIAIMREDTMHDYFQVFHEPRERKCADLQQVCEYCSIQAGAVWCSWIANPPMRGRRDLCACALYIIDEGIYDPYCSINFQMLATFLPFVQGLGPERTMPKSVACWPGRAARPSCRASAVFGLENVVLSQIIAYTLIKNSARWNRRTRLSDMLRKSPWHGRRYTSPPII
jgi:hypothetical protein